jgi:uncharacterized caspase-like protein
VGNGLGNGLGNNWAIVIGINEYEHHPEQNLAYATHDAQAIHDFLWQQAGFPQGQIKLCLGEKSRRDQPTYPNCTNLTRWLKRELQPEHTGVVDRFWFFFGGHSINRDGTDYLVPCDSLQEDPKFVLSVPEVIEALRNHEQADIVLILDNCRSRAGRDLGQAHPYSEETRRLAQQRKVVTLFACDHGQVAYELGAQQQGAFTCALLEGLQRHTLPHQLERFLQRRVAQLNRDNQVQGIQTPKILLDSAASAFLPLLPTCVTAADIETLRDWAKDAECEDQLDRAEQLWWQVIQSQPARGIFQEGQRAISRLHRKLWRQRAEGAVQQELERLRHLERDVRQQVEVVTDENQTLTVSLGEQEAWVELLQGEKETLENQLRVLEQEHQLSLNQQKRQYEQELQQLNSRAKETSQRLQEVQNQKEAVEARLVQEREQWRQEFEIKTGEYQEQLRQYLGGKEAEYQAQLEQQEREYQEQVAQLQKQIRDLQGRLAQVPSPKAKAKPPKSNSFFGFTLSQPELPQQEVALKSEKGVNYGKLRNLLSKGKWQAADQETVDRMLEAMGKEEWQHVKPEYLLDFPCADLRTIDDLWVHYSHGKFGFSVQKQIYLDCGAKLNGQYPGIKIWYKFCERVEWRVHGEWVVYPELTFTLKAPVGHLPRVRLETVVRGRILFEHGILPSLLSHKDL